MPDKFILHSNYKPTGDQPQAIEKLTEGIKNTKIVNCSQNVLKVSSAASLCIDFPSAELEMTTLKGSWAKERSVEKYPLHQGISSIESRRGASSHQLNPFAAFSEKGANESFGGVYGVSLVYSGDYNISAEADHMGNVRLIAGINPETFSWALKSGEELETPEAVITYSDEDALYSVEQLNITASGKTLMNVGLPFVKSLKEHESVLLDIVRQP